MKILCVGNSFAVDVSTYVHQIIDSIGEKLEIYVLYIPGCPINLHYKNIISGEKAYEFYSNGGKTPLMNCSIQEGLTYTKYDYITFQQRSGDSVDDKTFFPELSLLMNEIRKYSDAKYILHMTWSYAKEFSHERYGSNPLNQEQMDKDIFLTYEKVSKISKIKYIIPTGEAIKEARKIFGDNLTRDGYHLNERGRTLAGFVWAYFFFGLDIAPLEFIPSGKTYDNVTQIDNNELETLRNVAKKIILQNKEHNLW